MRLSFQEPTSELKAVSRIIPIAERIGMRLSFQEPTGEWKTESQIIPIAERIGIGLIPRLLKAGCFIESLTTEVNPVAIN